jgi:dipeptidyl aminopeptidase/acylaminoacyl peptidase
VINAAEGQFPTYSQSGHILYQRWGAGVELWAAPFSLAKLNITGEPFPVADSSFVFGVSRNGTLVYLERSAAVRQLITRDRTGRKVGSTGVSAEGLQTPSFSPDGKRVVFSAAEGMRRNIWISELDRPVKIPLTFARADTQEYFSGPAWSPSGDRIAFLGRVSSQWTVLSRSADGGGGDEKLLTSPNYVQTVNWYKPDRLLVSLRDRMSTKYRMEFAAAGVSLQDQDASNASSLPYSEMEGRVSPDGSVLALASGQSRRMEVYIRRLGQDAGGKQVSEGGGNDPRWRKDGRELFYREGNSIIAVSISTSANGFGIGKPQLLFTVDSDLANGYDVSSDGQRFLIPEPAEGTKPPRIRVVQNWSAAFTPRRSKSE